MQQKLLFLFCALINFCTPFAGQQFCEGAKITDISGNENPLIDCSYPLTGSCLQLTATYPEFHKTDSYTVSSEDFTPYAAFNAGTPLLADGDDSFFTKVEIPFNFCFFGQNYSSVIIGTNGVVSFNTSQLGNINYPNIDGLNPSATLPRSSIFGVYNDMVFSRDNDSEIYYSIVGSAPCRKLIINFYKGRLLGCNETATSQIVLSEGSNIIQVFVENKPLPCSAAKFENSLLGIINDDRTIGYSPEGRNTGKWAAQNEAWKFSPAGAPIMPQVTWFNSASQNVGSGATVSVCPEKNEIYTVKVKYPLCGNFEYTLEDTASVSFAPDYPLARNFNKILCGSSTFNINLDDYAGELTPQDPSNLIFSFHNTLAEAQSGANPQPKNLEITANKKFYVRVQNPSDPTCYRTSVLNLTMISNSLLTDTVEICDANNDGVENNFQLSGLNYKLFNAPINGSIHYFLTAADAAAQTNEVTATTLTATTQLYVTYKTATCSQVFGPISISFLPSPLVNSPITYQFTTCDYKYDLLEPFDFQGILGPLVTSEADVVLSFYNTYGEAVSGAGSSMTHIKEGNYQIFVRVQFPGGCYSIATVNMEITFTEVVAKNKSLYICFDGTEDISVNLQTASLDMLLQSPIGISFGFFNSAADADDNVNEISPLQTVTLDGSFVTRTFYVRFTDATGCYAVKEIKFNLVHVIIHQTQFDVCDFDNDGSEIYTLSNLSAKIKGPQNASVTYFATQADADTNTNSITVFNVQGSTKLYVRIDSYGCAQVFEINLNLVPTPVVQTTLDVVRNSICDNNNDGNEPFDLTALQPQIYSGSDAVTVQFYLNYNATNNSLSGLISNPTSFVIPKNSTVYAKVSFAGGCYSVSTINITLNFLPVIILKPALLQKCDYDFNLNESFNLTDALPQLFAQDQNSVPISDIAITYYKTENEANAGIVTTQISSPVTTTRSEVTVWARFTSKTTGCYSVAPIKLSTSNPPKAANSKITDICDDNLDGLYKVDLTKYTANMVYTQSANHIFTFFKTKADADMNSNPIADPANFSFASLPLKIWVRVENIPGCFDTASVDLGPGTKITLNGSLYTVTNTCDIGNDGKENVDLTQFQNTIYAGAATFEYYPSLIDLQNSTNKIASPKAFLYDENAGPQKIFVKVSAAGYCPEKAEINLTLKKTPMFTLPEYFFCKESSIDIKPDFTKLNIKKFEWLDPSGKIVSTSDQLPKVTVPGIYTINVTAQNDCTFSTKFTVQYYEVPVITDLVASGNTITVIATGSQKILYSKDGINFSENNVFPNLPFGVTTFYVKFEGSTCLPEKKEGLILDIKNAFTPNADGYNDTWIIDDLNVFNGKSANLKVFNRYQQKVFEQDSSTRFVWDGTTLSRVVNTDSYWYIITLPDGRTYTGWVLVKDRN
ncbi:T9SS type B sorting domain-containing protein [Kaistella palustris]|uniref:T9SS type B sorting domain-containing protein n=1 Tax=Kaistella palustris TaxID=493376 RepID=UPI00042527D9|nr:T9SS type B sorting domain-containing protein [Kaistella palustris]